MSLSYPHPDNFWKNTAARDRLRDKSLAFARQKFQQEKQSEEYSPQVFHGCHAGTEHIDFFNREMVPLIKNLQKDFRVLEIGAGMAWQSALFAAHGAGQVASTEFSWSNSSPLAPENAHSFERMLESEPKLKDVVTLNKNENGEYLEVNFDERIHCVAASGETLPFPDDYFDLVFCYNILEHVPDIPSMAAEIERVLKLDGLWFASTYYFYYSPYGHHLEGIFPLPWGHLLWETEELAELVLQEVGNERFIAPGQPLTKKFIVDLLSTELNFLSPEGLRNALKKGPWRIEAWVDLIEDEDRKLLSEFELAKEIPGISSEALLFTGVLFQLRKRPKAEGVRLPFHLKADTRKFLRKLRGKN